MQTCKPDGRSRERSASAATATAPPSTTRDNRRLEIIAHALHAHVDEHHLTPGLLRARAGDARIEIRIVDDRIHITDRSTNTARLRAIVNRCADVLTLVDPSAPRPPHKALADQQALAQIAEAIGKLGTITRRDVAIDRVHLDLDLTGAALTIDVRTRTLRVRVRSLAPGNPTLGTFLARLTIIANRASAWIELTCPRPLYAAVRVPALHTGFRPVEAAGSAALTRAPAA